MKNPDAAIGELSLLEDQHLHRGVLATGELLPILIHDYFANPSFDELLRELSPVCRMCLIEWLRCGGEYTLVGMSGPKPGTRHRQRSPRRCEDMRPNSALDEDAPLPPRREPPRRCRLLPYDSRS